MSQPVFTPVFEVLNERIQELPENFKDFAISECAWNEAWYNLYKQYPEMCSIEDQMTLLKIANDLAYDLLALITRCKQSREELFENKHAYKISDLDGQAYYWEVFDTNYDKEADPVQGWLVDDFADIYRDLEIELNKMDNIGSNEAVEDALWTLKWSFMSHWGQHCVSALRAFHFLNYDSKDFI